MPRVVANTLAGSRALACGRRGANRTRGWLGMGGFPTRASGQVVTPLATDNDSAAEDLRPGPDMVGQAKGHGRAAGVVAPSRGSARRAQCRMGPQPVVPEQRQPNEGPPGADTFGEGVGLATQTGQPVTQHPIEPLDMHGGRSEGCLTDGRVLLHAHEPAAGRTHLARLLRRDSFWHHQPRSARPAGVLGHLVELLDQRGIAAPAVTDVGQRLEVAAQGGLSQGQRKQVRAVLAAGGGDDEATGTVVDQTAPVAADGGRVGRTPLPVFFLMNDQNSSTSTVVRCRSWTRMAVMRSACSTASTAQRRMVSYVWPVMASAARRLPWWTRMV